MPARLNTPRTSLVLVVNFVLIGLSLAAEPDSTGRVPPPEPASTAIICHPDEPGPRLLISGRVVDDRGAPSVGASVTVYNTDAAGLYNPPRSATRTPRIAGTVTCDHDGRFQVLTVRPSAYPDQSLPRHIHFEVIRPGYHLRYTEVWFEGDPLITPAMAEQKRRRVEANPNEGIVIVPVRRLEGGLEIVEHTITLQPN